MILFTIALPQELKIIKGEIKNLNIKGFEVDFLLTGVGVLNSVYAIKNYIQGKLKPDFIINIGVCGKIDENFNDFFQVYRIKNLSNNKESICPIYIENQKLQSIACSDKIITNANDLNEERFVDMESFGIDFICDKEKIPYIILKKPFDIISPNSKKVSIEELENSLKGFDYEKLLSEINDFLKNNINEYKFENEFLVLKQKNRLTFSESELLKKYINKCVSFGENEKDILNRLINGDKKYILKLLN